MNTSTHAPDHTVVDHDRWLADRKALLAREKALTRLGDEIARERRALPWVRMDKPYVFDTPDGPRPLGDLFAGRRQLLVQHFMLGPGWAQGCPSCSYMADHVEGMLPHLAARDTTFTAVSRAPLAEIERFRERMGWRFPWVSSAGNEFNVDFHVSFSPEDQARGEVDYNFQRQAFPHDEAPGVSAFWRDDAGDVYLTYSTYGRGVEVMMGTYDLLDLTAKGRDEAPGEGMAWVRHHDRYAPAPSSGSSCCAARR
ncbi:MAG: DUF899 domain-containing protein [Rhizobacter sp.]|jgi:predicted dithiol-disulfide oxidoreductase (DUF899 family)